MTAVRINPLLRQVSCHQDDIDHSLWYDIHIHSHSLLHFSKRGGSIYCSLTGCVRICMSLRGRRESGVYGLASLLQASLAGCDVDELSIGFGNRWDVVILF